MIKNLNIFVLFLLFTFSNYTLGNNLYFSTTFSDVERRVVNIPSNAVLTDYFGEGSVNIHYIIRHEHDLRPYTEGVTIGNNCIVEIKRGGFNNGKLICRNICITGRKPRFKDVYLHVRDADKVEANNINATYTYAIDDFFRIENSKNVYIKGVKVVFDKGNKQFPSGKYIEAEGFDLNNCENISFSNCSIYNSKSQYADSGHGSLVCKNSKGITVDGCFSSGGHNEVFCFINCENVTVRNTKVDGGDGSAISTQGGKRFIIDHCESYNVGASAFSFNSREMRITNCIAKDWHRFNGITLGHSASKLRVNDVHLSNCRIILSTKNDSQKKCAFGGVINGSVNINNCRSKTSRICNFDAVFESEIVSLTLDKNYFEVFEGDAFSEIFRTSDVLNLTVINNTFDGNACINGYIREYDGVPASNWIIRGNVFKHLKQAPVIHPNVKKNTSNGTFVFSDNVIERTDASILRYYYLEEKSTVDFISLPHYSHRIVSNNKIRKLKGNVRLFGTEQSDGVETVFTGNSLDGKGVDLEKISITE